MTEYKSFNILMLINFDNELKKAGHRKIPFGNFYHWFNLQLLIIVFV